MFQIPGNFPTGNQKNKVKEFICTKFKELLKKLIQRFDLQIGNEAGYDEVIKEIGLPMSDRVFPEWQKWLNKEVKGKRF